MKFALLAVSLLFGCKGKEIYPEVPEITFKSAYFNDKDSSIVLTIGYRDGDGDIGFNPEDTLAPYNNIPNGPNGSNTNRFYDNVWIDYYEYKQGHYYIATIPNAPGDTVRKDVRVGNLTPEGAHKAIRGEIRIEMSKLKYDNSSDTIKLKARLVDRALHVSNEIESPDIYLYKQ